MNGTKFSLKEVAGRLGDVLFRHDDAVLRELLQKTGDDEVVHIIDSLAPPEKRRTFRTLPVDRRSRIINKVSDYSDEVILPALSQAELRAMLDVAESDDAVDIIQLLEEQRRDKVIEDLRKSDPKGLLPLLVFGEETAGGLMKTEVLKFAHAKKVDEVRRHLASTPPGKPRSHQIYVVDETGVLVGTLSLMRLLQSPADATLKEVAYPPPAVLPATMDQEEVAKLFDEHNAIELPVVGHRGQLLGCITADDIFEVMEEEFAEDVSRMAGVHEDAHITDPAAVAVRRRIPWLTLNLGTALVAASVVGLFEDTIARVAILAAFMPVVAGLGGNAAQQTLGLTIRAIAFGELHHLNRIKAIVKEMVVGAANGLLTGAVMAAVVYFWTKNPTLAAVMAAAMTANMLVAGFVGVLIPLVLKSLKIDPAIASTVFVTATTDVCGFFAFLGMASLFL
jgi:magnesium transporter